MNDLIDCANLREHVEMASVALARWAYRDESKDPQVRRSANLAVESIDAALTALHRIRQELVGQIREYDDATAKRVDELLARRRAEWNAR